MFKAKIKQTIVFIQFVRYQDFDFVNLHFNQAGEKLSYNLEFYIHKNILIALSSI